MSNKHEPYEAFILHALARGVMKSQIVHELKERGLKTTGDEIRRWLGRRVKRAQANAGMLEVLRSGVPSSAVQISSPTPSPVAAPAAQPVPAAIAPAPDRAPAEAAEPALAQAPEQRLTVPAPDRSPKVKASLGADFRKRGQFNVDILSEEKILDERKEKSLVNQFSKKKPE